MSIKFWEKSVEYKFVMELARSFNKTNLIAPLSGNEEGAIGDGILMNDDARYFVIEFKRTATDLYGASEMKKYGEPALEKNARIDDGEKRFNKFLTYFRKKGLCPHTHLAVFGVPSNNSIELDFVDYLHGTKYTESIFEFISSPNKNGLPLEAFLKYAKALAKWRFYKTSNDGEDEGGNGDVMLYAVSPTQGRFLIPFLSFLQIKSQSAPKIKQEINGPI